MARRVRLCSLLIVDKINDGGETIYALKSQNFEGTSVDCNGKLLLFANTSVPVSLDKDDEHFGVYRPLSAANLNIQQSGVGRTPNEDDQEE